MSMASRVSRSQVSPYYASAPVPTVTQLYHADLSIAPSNVAAVRSILVPPARLYSYDLLAEYVLDDFGHRGEGGSDHRRGFGNQGRLDLEVIVRYLLGTQLYCLFYRTWLHDSITSFPPFL